MKILTHRDGVKTTGLYLPHLTKVHINDDILKVLGQEYYLDGKPTWDILTSDGKFFHIKKYIWAGVFEIYSKEELTQKEKEFFKLAETKPKTSTIITISVKSFSNSLKEYKVNLHTCGKFSCSCKDYTNRDYHECKHIRRVKDKLIELEKIR